jgi:putative ABC transport system permease protein
MLSRLKTTLRALLRRTQAERELDEELRYHIEQQTEQNIRLGMNPEEARQAALKSFGGVEQAKERSRDARGMRWIEDLWLDLRYGLRMLMKNPGFTLIAVLTLALGIGANTAVFSVINAVSLRPLPFLHPERLTMVMAARTKTGATGYDHSYLNFADYRSRNTVFEALTAYSDYDATLIEGEAPERVSGMVVSADFFRALGVNMQLGRAFTANDEQPGAESVIISYGLWQRRLGANPNVVGRRIMLDGKQKIIIGVTPANFNFPLVNREWDFFSPFDPKGGMETQRGAGYLQMLGRLKPGVAIEQAEAEMRAIASNLEEQYKDFNAGKSVSLIPAHEYLVGDLNSLLLVLLGSVGFVLLIACANVANLQLARSVGRGRETAIRAALGGSRGRIVRQLLTESLVLSVVGGLIGLLLAAMCTDLIVKFVPTDIPRIGEVGIDQTVLAFSLGLSVLTSMLFGLAPALQSSRFDLNAALKDAGRSATGGQGRSRLRSLLIVSEVALSLALLIGAGLLIKSFQRLRHTSPGFDPQRVLTATVSLPEVKYANDAQQIEFFRRAMERISSIPGVEAVGAIFGLPYSGDDISASFSIEGQPDPGPGKRPRAGARMIAPDYIRTMGIPLIKGRMFNDQDGFDAPKVMLINETLARRFFPGQDPIGKRLKQALKGITGEIVGVVGDVRDRALGKEAPPEFYLPYTYMMAGSMSITARVKTGDPMNLAAPLRAAVREIDKELPVYQVRSMESRVSDSLTRQRFSMTLLTALAGLAMVLAVAGIFSVMSFLVAQRTHEIGIRTALGAQRLDVLRLILGQGMKLTIIGIAIGLVLSFTLTQLMKEFLYQVKATDPLTFVVVSMILAVVALAACWFPALRATKVDPLVALRNE